MKLKALRMRFMSQCVNKINTNKNVLKATIGTTFRLLYTQCMLNRFCILLFSLYFIRLFTGKTKGYSYVKHTTELDPDSIAEY